MNPYLFSRRNFLKQSSIAMAGLAASGNICSSLFAANQSGVSIIVDPGDTIAGSAPPQWAAAQLKQALEGLGVTVRVLAAISTAPDGDIVIIIGSPKTPIVQQILASTGINMPAASESLVLANGSVSGKLVLLLSGNDARGLVYAILELTDRVLYSDSISAACTITTPIVEQSHTMIRSIVRSFQSELEDKPWFNDKTFWTGYLSMLASERVNRFGLSFGAGSGWLTQTPATGDAYTFFMYPFFVAVDGVSVGNLPASERDSNLAMLRFISDECAKRALDFQLGIWTSGFTYVNSRYPVQGLSGVNGSTGHANYCRNALAAVLEACPNITGVTFRVHSESGIPLGNYAFWQTHFSGVTSFVNAGRRLEIDMHGKQCMQGHIDAALSSKAAVVVSPKKLGEHQGLPYHAASLRAQDRSSDSDRTILNGQASRHGYANFLREDRKYGVLHRLWPGTQRHLLWGDPVFAAAYGRSSSFCGSLGMEWNEPLSFKGREGSGTTGGRCAYSDASLTPAYDYQKFLYSYRVWCRCLYNPDTSPETWRRYLVKQFGTAARSVEDALGNASRILMLVTTYHGAGVANQDYWPEMYTNYSIADGQPIEYKDSQNPLRLTTSFDPQLFLDIDPYAEALLSGNHFSQDKYFPIEVSQWLEDFANVASSSLAAAEASVLNMNDPAFRRLSIDVKMQSKLGLFFGCKFRSAVLWSIYRKTNDTNAKTAALELYQSARQAWIELASIAAVYKNVTYGGGHSTGHWSDRTAAITSDINAMSATTYSSVSSITTFPGPAPSAIAAVKGRPARPAPGASHTPPNIFSPGSALNLVLNADANTTAVKLYYRHVNQADTWQSMNMSRSGSSFQAAIPGSYTQTVYPLQYYFALAKGNAGVLFPGFNSTLSNQPYFVVRSVSQSSLKFSLHNSSGAAAAISDIAVFQRGGAIEVRYALNRMETVSARLFDCKGQLAASFLDEHKTMGRRVMKLDLKNRPLSSGKYVLRIAAGGTKISRTVNFLR